MAESLGEGQVLTSLGMALTSGIRAKGFYLYKILVSEQKDLGLAFSSNEKTQISDGLGNQRRRSHRGCCTAYESYG